MGGSEQLRSELTKLFVGYACTHIGGPTFRHNVDGNRASDRNCLADFILFLHIHSPAPYATTHENWPYRLTSHWEHGYRVSSDYIGPIHSSWARICMWGLFKRGAGAMRPARWLTRWANKHVNCEFIFLSNDWVVEHTPKGSDSPSAYARDAYTCVDLCVIARLPKRVRRVVMGRHNSEFSQRESIRYRLHASEGSETIRMNKECGIRRDWGDLQSVISVNENTKLVECLFTCCGKPFTLAALHRFFVGPSVLLYIFECMVVEYLPLTGFLN